MCNLVLRHGITIYLECWDVACFIEGIMKNEQKSKVLIRAPEFYRVADC